MTSPKRLFPASAALAALFLLTFMANLPGAQARDAAQSPLSPEQSAAAKMVQARLAELHDPPEPVQHTWQAFDPLAPGVSSAGILTGHAARRLGIRCLGRIASIVGTSHNDRIWGTDGQDVIVARGGDDLITSGNANDRICGNGGEDQAYGLADNDRLQGDSQADQLLGGAGSDRMWGNRGDDEMNGEAGQDYLYGDDGRDTMTGDTGGVEEGVLAPEPLQGEGGGGLTTSSDFLYGGPDEDTLDGGSGIDNLYGQGSGDTLLGGTESDRMIGGPGRDTFDGGDGNDTMTGAAGDDNFSGGIGFDTIYGDGGSDVGEGSDDQDTINGGADPDFLFGEGGRDTIHGDGGDDTLCGGPEPDSLFGGDQDDYLDGLTDPEDCLLFSSRAPDVEVFDNLNDGGPGIDMCINPSDIWPQTVRCEIGPDRILTVTPAGDGDGVVTDDIGLIDCPDVACVAQYPDDEIVTLDAFPTPPDSFTGWSVTPLSDGQTCPGVSCVIVMDANLEVFAFFDAP